MKLLQPGACEGLKAATHVGLGTLGTFAAICFTYNVCAYAVRREPHLRRNAVLYGAIVALEAIQVTKHCRR